VVGPLGQFGGNIVVAAADAVDTLAVDSHAVAGIQRTVVDRDNFQEAVVVVVVVVVVGNCTAVRSDTHHTIVEVVGFQKRGEDTGYTGPMVLKGFQRARRTDTCCHWLLLAAIRPCCDLAKIHPEGPWSLGEVVAETVVEAEAEAAVVAVGVVVVEAGRYNTDYTGPVAGMDPMVGLRRDTYFGSFLAFLGFLQYKGIK